MDIESQ
ncbi:uncharacterized protein FRV6_10976 [Fusarium oxysporum]|nr:uncharacterized protein FRV6_10976 [Fusarium oxysporum]